MSTAIAAISVAALGSGGCGSEENKRITSTDSTPENVMSDPDQKPDSGASLLPTATPGAAKPATPTDYLPFTDYPGQRELRKRDLDDFKYRPLLFFSGDGYRERIFIRPKGKFLQVNYEPPGASSEDMSHSELLAAGGIAISHTRWEPGTSLSYYDRYKRITSRGREALLSEMRTNAPNPPSPKPDYVTKSNLDERDIEWIFELSDKGFLHINLQVHPDRFSLETQLRMAEELAQLD